MRAIPLLTCAGALALPSAASALTPPQPGAVPLPAGFELSFPFPEDTQVLVACAYGPGCSTFHTGTDNPGSSNDYHALDLVRDQAGGGNGEAVTAAASGRVIYAGWATGGWSSFGRLVMIEHDYDDDGNTYHSIYAHLASISVSQDEIVESKQEIGLLGGSSNMADDVFGAHVHFALYRDAMVGGGPYGGQAVVPEPIDGHADLVDGSVGTAGPGPSSGESSESSSTVGGESGTDTTAGTTSGGDPTTGPASTSVGGGTPGGTSSSSSTSGTTTPFPPPDDAETGGGSYLTTGGRGRGEQGCACSSTPAPSEGAVLCLGVLALGRRRRRAR